MNKTTYERRKGGSRKERELEQRRLEMERLKQEVLLHAQELAAEMNLRLLLDGETVEGGEDEMLFVESVIVTGIAYPVKRRKSLFGRAKSLMKKILTYMVRLPGPKLRRTRTRRQAPQQLR